MWPLYDPSMYQPPAPIKRMTPAEFNSLLAELEHKPDVDNVYEAISSLQGQESLRPSRLTARQFFFHPFMIFPGVTFLLGVILLVGQQMSAGGARSFGLGAPHSVLAPNAAINGSPLFILFLGLAIMIIPLRSAIRDKDPEVVAMRAATAGSISRMALSPKYIHEPFSSADRDYLRRLLRKRSADADKALKVLLSMVGTAREPDPEFRGGEPGSARADRRSR
jgi:hypothetical protein